MGSCISKLPSSNDLEEEIEEPMIARALRFPSPQIKDGHLVPATILRSNGTIRRNQQVIVPAKAHHQSPSHAYWLLRRHRKSSYGSVWQALLVTQEKVTVQIKNEHWTATNISCAVKEYSKEALETRNLIEDPSQEIASMQHLLHVLVGEITEREESIIQKAERIRTLTLKCNVLLPLDVIQEKRDGRESCLYLITPFLGGGTVMERMQDIPEIQAGFSKEETRQLMMKITNGMKNLHEARICHFDLNLKNILLSDEANGMIPILYGLGKCFRISYERTGQRRHIRWKSYNGLEVSINMAFPSLFSCCTQGTLASYPSFLT